MISKRVTYEFLGGNYRRTQRKSRVWLCSAQLFIKLKIKFVTNKHTFNTLEMKNKKKYHQSITVLIETDSPQWRPIYPRNLVLVAIATLEYVAKFHWYADILKFHINKLSTLFWFYGRHPSVKFPRIKYIWKYIKN